MVVRTVFAFSAATCCSTAWFAAWFAAALRGQRAATMHLRYVRRMSRACARSWLNTGLRLRPGLRLNLLLRTSARRWLLRRMSKAGMRRAAALRSSFRSMTIRRLMTGRRSRRSSNLTARRRRASTRGWRVIGPARRIVVPRTVTVVMAPIGIDGKHDDRQPDLYAVSHNRNIRALVRIAETPAVDPSAQVWRCDVAPAVTLDAAHHCKGHALWHLGYYRVIRCGTGVDIHGRIRVRLDLRESRAGECCQTDTWDSSNDNVLLHDFSQTERCLSDLAVRALQK